MDLDELHNLSVPPRRSDLMLFDFAPHAVRKEQSRSGASTSASATPDETDAEVEVEAPTLTPPSFTTEVVTRPSVLEKAGIWKDDVVSGLPYRLVRRDWGERANGVMIDDQRIIIIRVSRTMSPHPGRGHCVVVLHPGISDVRFCKRASLTT